MKSVRKGRKKIKHTKRKNLKNLDMTLDDYLIYEHNWPLKINLKI